MTLTLRTKYLAAAIFNKVLPLRLFFMRQNKRYIFAYHRIVTHEKARKFHMQKSMWISPETFSDDINWMLEHGDIVDLDTILDFEFQNKKPLFSITFDDGWADNYSIAYPILKQYSIPATIFLVTDSVESGNIFWVEDFLYKIAMINSGGTHDDTLYKLKNCAKKYDINIWRDNNDLQSFSENLIEQLKPLNKNLRTTILLDVYKTLDLDLKPIKGEILNWDQVNEMNKNQILFGSHTHTHEILQYSSDKKAMSELYISKKIISSKTGGQIKYFCYPNARYNTATPKLIKNTDYSHAFRIHNLPLTSTTDRYLVPRFLLNETVCKNKDYLMCKLLGFPKF